MLRTFSAVLCGLTLLSNSAAAQSSWAPTKPVEFIVTAGAGGGTDIFARTVQTIVQKYNLMPQPMVVQIKSGGSGAEGYVYMKTSEGDPHKLVFGTHNIYVLPLAAKVAFTHKDLTPVAAMALDEFILWVNGESPVKDVKSFIAAGQAKPEGLKMAGAQSKDSDELLTKLIEKASGTKLIYIPYKSGGEADFQLSGGHVDAHVNNPSESTGNWKAGKVRPLCVFNAQRLAAGAKITATESWADIPTCKDQGLAVDPFAQPRIASLPGKVPPAAVAYWQSVFKKVSETPEWKEYIARTAQSDRFIGGGDLETFIAGDYERFRGVFAEQGWLVK